MKTYRFSIIIEKDEEGYFAICPELQGCYTQGDTYEEVLDNIKDAIRLHVMDRLDNGEKISQSYSISFTSMEVAVSQSFGRKIQRVNEIDKILIKC